MGAFEYLSVLISIILALGMTRVLAGVGEVKCCKPAPFDGFTGYIPSGSLTCSYTW
jgi:hypothetical protein